MIEQVFSEKYKDSELVIGIVGPVGTDFSIVVKLIVDRLKNLKYEPHEIRISKDVIPNIIEVSPSFDSESERISVLMTAGNDARTLTKDNAILALGAAAAINNLRPEEEPKIKPRNAYIINSLKHPSEVIKLREIYGDGFFLLGIHASRKERLDNLMTKHQATLQQAEALIERDENEHIKSGQKMQDTFHLSDFFLPVYSSRHQLEDSINRIIDLMFGDPHKTPTFEEFAMFMAFASSLRSADLSRQVGAVIAKNGEILATGANDVPKAGGGLYYPIKDPDGKIIDVPDGRDRTREKDPNKAEQEKIISNILSGLEGIFGNIDKSTLIAILKDAGIKDLTEYGRIVHAELEALLCCARNNISCRGGTLYCTTFPCHNCAKHIIAAGIKRVVYIEPYPKSKAAEFYSDSIEFNNYNGDHHQQNSIEPSFPSKVSFESFEGVGPRRFFDLFSMHLSSGYPLIRKTENGDTLKWFPTEASLRMQMLPTTYLDREKSAQIRFAQHHSKISNNKSL